MYLNFSTNRRHLCDIKSNRFCSDGFNFKRVEKEKIEPISSDTDDLTRGARKTFFKRMVTLPPSALQSYPNKNTFLCKTGFAISSIETTFVHTYALSDEIKRETF
jgi:hypothetical protein